MKGTGEREFFLRRPKYVLDDNFAMKTARNISAFMEQFYVPFAPVFLLTNQEYTFVEQKGLFFSLCGVLKNTNPLLTNQE